MGDTRNSRFTDPVLAALQACLQEDQAKSPELVAAYSGGLDSTVLLHAAHRVAGLGGCSLRALHIHHGLNPNADEWAAHCADSAEALGVPLRVVKVAVSRDGGKGVEAAARDARHAIFAGYADSLVLLAHHADDQAETMLHNLIRGAGVRGAAAMSVRRGNLLRPFLDLPRARLADYATRHHLRWIDDESNSDQRFTRNYLRHRVMPALKQRFPAASLNLAAAARRFAEATKLLDDLALADLGELPARFPLPLPLVKGLPAPRACNLLRTVFSRESLHAPDDRRLTEFVRQLQTAALDRHPSLQLPDYSLRASRGQLWLVRRVVT